MCSPLSNAINDAMCEDIIIFNYYRQLKVTAEARDSFDLNYWQ